MESTNDGPLSESTLSERVARMLSSAKFCDIQFKVGYDDTTNVQLFHAHRVILAASSPVFAANFYGALAENIVEPIRIPDIQPATFQALLDYIYKDTVTLLSFDDAIDLYYAAKKYMLPHLLGSCKKYLLEKLTPAYACRAYEFGEQYDEQQIFEEAKKIIMDNTMSVLDDSGFYKARVSTVIAIFSFNYLNIESENNLLKALERYVQRRNLLSIDRNEMESPNWIDALKKIRFLALTPIEFFEGPAFSVLLTNTETLTLLAYKSLLINNPHFADYSLPLGHEFSIEKNTRHKVPSARSHKLTLEPRSGPYQRKIESQSDGEFSEVVSDKILICVSRAIFISGISVTKFIYSCEVLASISDEYGNVLTKKIVIQKLRSETYKTCHKLLINFDRQVYIPMGKIYTISLRYVSSSNTYFEMKYVEIYDDVQNDVTFKFTSGIPGRKFSFLNGIIYSL